MFFYLDSTGKQNRKLKIKLQECSFCNLKMSEQIDIRFCVLQKNNFLSCHPVQQCDHAQGSSESRKESDKVLQYVKEEGSKFQNANLVNLSPLYG
jgi:hypothetical protein